MSIAMNDMSVSICAKIQDRNERSQNNWSCNSVSVLSYTETKFVEVKWAQLTESHFTIVPNIETNVLVMCIVDNIDWRNKNICRKETHNTKFNIKSTAKQMLAIFNQLLYHLLNLQQLLIKLFIDAMFRIEANGDI